MKEIEPIAYIRTDFKEKFGIPRQSGRVNSLVGRIEFVPKYRDPEAIRELDGFSHIWLVFGFSGAEKNNWSATVRPPRLGGNRRVGVFASRSPFRPNGLGLSSVKLTKIEKTSLGVVLVVSGADLLDMTPIYDIKPYLPNSDCHTDALEGYTSETKGYRLNVIFPDELLEKIPSEKRDAVAMCLADDPRPSYHEDAERVYTMNFAGYEISFKAENNILTVIAVEIENAEIN